VVLTGHGMSFSILVWSSRFIGCVIDVVCISHHMAHVELSAQLKFSMLMILTIYETGIVKSPSVK
jgi:hypothetical protein